MRYLVILFLVFSGCTKQSAQPFCKAGIKAAVYSAQGLAAALDCKNVGEMTADFSKPILGLELCKVPLPVGMMGDLACPAIAKYITSLGVNVVPANWECKGGVVLSQATKLLTESCKAVIPY